ncbi:hypothetical protein TTHERM_000192138 (macronuclear) [Tetrahymena thermophila SB210]|uniref:Uncharacterized protein n=1 Tax=Tetrahymena thermophila (strain SB210) TaxID=312017 RepID=W7XI19_TETTS|nr:hypothetical protein TTHERM_000192138 [Tetrahymena thermophila SB210]EWS74266.1 hypothetical protein TTHERM_000192138 [Tetrahymena thermophila SB210]|eukprot:XP_012653239.1 hypothetical protein TTHERM_000192138 [Tetrahymena thermophila SB210]
MQQPESYKNSDYKGHIGFLLDTNIKMNMEQELQNNNFQLKLQQEKIGKVFNYLNQCSRLDSSLVEYQQWYKERSQNPPSNQEIIDFIIKKSEFFFIIKYNDNQNKNIHQDFRKQEIFNVKENFQYVKLFGDIIQDFMKKESNINNVKYIPELRQQQSSIVIQAG